MATGYDPGALWLVVLAGGVGTFALRLSFIALFGRLDEVPAGLERALRFVPAAVLAALVVPRLVLGEGGGVALPPGNLRLVAGALAAAVAWYTEDVTATLVAGMAGLWLLSALVG